MEAGISRSCSMIRNLLTLLLAIAIGVLVFLGTRWFYKTDAPAPEEVSATVLLERVRPVLKLITVEGDFNELYQHKDSWTYNTMVRNLPAFQKKAILRVRARVSIGYDLNGMTVSADEATRTLTLHASPKPQVLSIEHDVDYYDITEGMFNHFTPQELSLLQAKAKQKVLDKVPQSGLYAEAERQRAGVIDVVRSIAETAGWQVRLGHEDDGSLTLRDGRLN
jgi:hypothetical protein